MKSIGRMSVYIAQDIVTGYRLLLKMRKKKKPFSRIVGMCASEIKNMTIMLVVSSQKCHVESFLATIVRTLKVTAMMAELVTESCS